MCMRKEKCVWERKNVFKKGKMYKGKEKCVLERKNVYENGKTCIRNEKYV